MGKEYVAFHSLGAETGIIGLKIIENVKIPDFSDYQEVKIVRKMGKTIDVSTIWYKGEGLKTYLLIKDLIT